MPMVSFMESSFHCTLQGQRGTRATCRPVVPSTLRRSYHHHPACCLRVLDIKASEPCAIASEEDGAAQTETVFSRTHSPHASLLLLCMAIPANFTPSAA